MISFAALEIPADLLLKKFNASYSASRAALLEAWKAFKMRREWLADDFCRPLYEVWMSEAVARGRIYAPGFFTNPAIHAGLPSLYGLFDLLRYNEITERLRAPPAGCFRVVRVVVPLCRFVAFLRLLSAFLSPSGASALVRIRCLLSTAT